MTVRWRRSGRVISAPAARFRAVGSGGWHDPLWQASCGGTRSERARAAERLGLSDFLDRPPRPHPPLRSI